MIEEPRVTEEGVSSWSTTHVRELIRRKAGVTYTLRHLIRLMHRWGFEDQEDQAPPSASPRSQQGCETPVF
jgi:transposase